MAVASAAIESVPAPVSTSARRSSVLRVCGSGVAAPYTCAPLRVARPARCAGTRRLSTRVSTAGWSAAPTRARGSHAKQNTMSDPRK